MSAVPAARTVPAPAFRPASRPAASPRTTPPAPRLRVVRAPQTARTRVPFVVLCMAILAGALLCALLLNTTMARGAYEAHDLKQELARLAQQELDLSAELDARAAPEALAASARSLGMVPAASPAWLRLSDGAVLGSPTPAGAGG